MKRLFLPLFLLILLVLESTAADLLPKEWIAAGVFPIPHWTLVLTIMIAVFYDRDHTFYCVIYAVIFGFLIDLTYTNILGVYMFTYGLVVYIIHGLKQMLHPNFVVGLLLVFLGLALADHIIYVMYFMIGKTDLTWIDYTSDRLIPTLLGNILFFLIIYPIFQKRLQIWSEEQLSEKK
ncbi:rod shape-determining protein MreD [Salirhabdus euzebyi]|uniref:Rod shape-determining protein MreD n=1 Tax=Salirhabdus euzebyi TaxID=394506 RepID=A0A841PSX4_9BACI|nr:rod shape-determining protein MreD [Salirhabdus euzebyi]MBB6451919.1 rod shape-determining protein MreD [Salirhabdus euzebyi]